jgi:error-prone DNA polymerase
MRLAAGMRETEAQKITATIRQRGSFNSVTSLWRASAIRTATLRTLAMADAFTSMKLDRQQALWAVSRLKDDFLPMFDGMDADEPVAALPAIAPSTSVVQDYSALGLSLKAHPISFVREALAARGVTQARQMTDEAQWPHGRSITVAGLALIRQRPGTASGIIFMTIEDETGVANLVIRPAVYERYRRAIRHSTAIVASGKIERAGQVVHVLVHQAKNLSDVVNSQPPKAKSRDFR